MVLSRINIENACELLDTIDLLKTQLLKYGIEKGLNDPNTIQISEQLDTYIVMYQKKMAQKQNTIHKSSANPHLNRLLISE